MPRAIWSGTISFGLVSVPVWMFAAVSEHKLHFNLLHRKDESPIGYEKVCKLEGKPVPDDEIVKAYEIEKGEFVYVEDEDFQAARAEGGHAFDIEQFVPVEDIDPIYFEHSYYLGPQDGAEKVYMLLVRAMEDAGLAAIGTFLMRDREYLGCLRIREGVITLERMYFADEIRAPEGIAPAAAAKVDKRQLEMANDLIKAYTGSFDPTQYSDTYRARLLAVIEAKRTGATVTAKAADKPDTTPDMMAAQTASLDQARDARAARAKPAKAAPKRTKAAAGAGGSKAPARKRRSA